MPDPIPHPLRRDPPASATTPAQAIERAIAELRRAASLLDSRTVEPERARRLRAALILDNQATALVRAAEALDEMVCAEFADGAS